MNSEELRVIGNEFEKRLRAVAKDVLKEFGLQRQVEPKEEILTSVSLRRKLNKCV